MTPAGNGFSPLVMLAMGVHTQPGVYAVLLGSGVSTAAGIPTGWGVVRELVGRAAAAANPADADAAAKASADPETWWQTVAGEDTPLGYSSLLQQLAPTQAARSALLAKFFEPTEEEREAGLKVPTRAHRAIARLVKDGYIRVILTTNFDRLMERALEEEAITPTVIAQANEVAGAAELQHATVTVIKLHGDYTDLESRNTVDELSTYPEEWNRLLARVLNEYGLIISGWSADWDTALVAAFNSATSRRYPLYWDARSSKGNRARRLVINRNGVTIPAGSADQLFTELFDSVTGLARLAEPPLTIAMAVARLKRYLPDPTRHIDLHDLIMGRVEQVIIDTADLPVNDPNLTPQRYQDVLEAHRRNVAKLLPLLVTGVTFDRGNDHQHLWIALLKRLMQAKPPHPGTTTTVLNAARHYPALLALRAMGTAAIAAGRYDALHQFLTKPTFRSDQGRDREASAVHALHDFRIFKPDHINALPRWSDQKFYFPLSHLIRADLREFMQDVLPDDLDYQDAFDDFEYLSGLLVQSRTTTGMSPVYPAAPGEFVLEERWTYSTDGEPAVPNAENRSLRKMANIDSNSPWTELIDWLNDDTVSLPIYDYRTTLLGYRQ